MLSFKFMLRVVALLALSLWAQNAAALSCGPATGSVCGNTAAEFFANANEGTFGSVTVASALSTLTATLSGFYNGIGAVDFESYGAEIKWEMCF